MKIALTADIHARGKDLDACRAQLNALVDECMLQQVEALAVAGDVYDRSNIHDNHGSTGAVERVVMGAIRRLTDHGIDVLMIPGNHDKAGAGSEDALAAFDFMDNVTVIRRPSMHVADSTGGLGLDPVRILCLPWSWGGEDPAAVLSALCASDTDILLAHVQVTGARMSGAFCCPAAPGKWQVSREFLESLPVERFALGDFHARQELVPGKGGYIGALRQLNFGEEGNPAGFEIFDTETGAAWWVELDAAPKHRTFTADGEIPVEFETLNEAAESSKVRVRYDGVTPDPIMTRHLESAGVVVETVIEREERVRRAEVPEGVLADPRRLMDLYTGTQNPPWAAERTIRMVAAWEWMNADKTGAPAVVPAECEF